MQSATSGPNNSNILPIAAGEAAAAAKKEATPERRRELEETLSRSLPRFRGMAIRSLRNHEDAEDAVQDAMLSAVKHLGSFDGRAQMSTWLTAIVINAVRMQLRRRPRTQIVSIDQSAAEGQRPISQMLAHSGPTPEKHLEQREMRDLVGKLTNSLPASQQAALRLRQHEGLSIKEAAKKLGVPEGTVKAHLTRGRTKLMQRFQAATARRKTQFVGSVAKTSRKAPHSGYARESQKVLPGLPIAAFGQQGGCENWIGA